MSINNIKNIKSKNSEIFIGDGVFDVLQEYVRPYQEYKIFILVDENTMQHCIPKLVTKIEFLQNAEIIEIDSGEENKTLDICYQIWKTLSDYKADRQSLLLNVGGGVISDMGGFIASTFKRGIDFINVPTTLLSQIDASVGGKVGVDLEGLKNMIGVFNEPKGVFIYPNFLKTLDKRQMLSGYAEAIKHALIKEESYWLELKKGMLSDAKNWLKLITNSVHIKNDIVLIDPKETKERKLLNFGHTIGHALETYSLNNDESLLHGEAIAIGIICESYISTLLMGLSEAELKDISTTILKLYTPFKFGDSDFHQLIELMKKDKKNKKGAINCTLLSEIGVAHVDKEVKVEVILDALNYYNSLVNKQKLSQ